MERKLRKTLEKQLELLIERAEKCTAISDLIEINHAINETHQIVIFLVRGMEEKVVSTTDNSNKKCSYCGREQPIGNNFCGYCGIKVSEICDCWVKEKPYNCGRSKCPGIRLFLIEKGLKS